jgi:hypothetical protein
MTSALQDSFLVLLENNLQKKEPILFIGLSKLPVDLPLSRNI